MRRHLITACWILLGAALLAPRIAVIHQGLWHDEIYTVQQYVSGGPAAIFGHYDANDHMLFSVLAWLTVRVPGGPDVAYRLWGIVPFLAAVATTALWLRARANLASALVFTTLAASSARLLELTSEARGYGLAYFAMSILVIACYEARATGRRAWLTVLCVAGVAGVWTIPTFVLPAVGAAAALALSTPSVRRPLLLRLPLSAAAIGAWYAPVLPGLLRSTGQDFGHKLPWHAVLTGPFTLFTDAFFEDLPVGQAAVVSAVIAPVLALGAWQAHRRLPGVVGPTAAAIVVTYGVLTIGRFHVEQRFFSYLLVPLFVYASLGCAALLEKQRRPWARILSRDYAGSIVAVAVVSFLLVLPGSFSLPFEAHREAARAVTAVDARGTIPVLLNAHSPDDLRYYLPPTIRAVMPPPDALERRLCSPNRRGLIFVQQPFMIEQVDTSCLARDGATLERFRQRGRGGNIAVWILPAHQRRSLARGSGIGS